MQMKIKTAIVLLLVILCPASAIAVTGTCSGCHTMHNSINGTVAAGKTKLLSTATCVGCHQGEPAAGAIPSVYTSSAPANILAGGNLYWATVSEGKGHNVTGMAADSALGNLPPGGTNLGGQLNCAGSRGCHGARTAVDEFADMSGAHHSNATGQLTVASRIGNSYRFLSGIHGYEDTDYQFTVSASDHNEYKGVDKSGGADNSTPSGYANTISYFCGICHTDFHRTASAISSGNNMTSPWLRHPTDFDMGNLGAGTEYASYLSYSTLAPVARLTIPATSISTADPQDGTADDTIVMCLSCHRAHGTAYNDLLRWDYGAGKCQSGQGVDATCGCFACHTTKDT